VDAMVLADVGKMKEGGVGGFRDDEGGEGCLCDTFLKV
jgi:hypothetical protein